ncbi:hypothetical protein PVAND_013641 [Polypedilum vanderplanki]|uniref:Oligopeptide transporter 1 n=1 Tax=Polypedilum vanderplanki TaxID=319348 RepID=A0A9J6CS09_POLVA|nr:hypothetical protein PVAND_013641 [Polypedilum vanderplanki]
MSTDNTSEKDIMPSNSNVGDVESDQKKVRYPFSVFFIISNEFCERFNYYGMRTILSLYLTRKLLFDDDIATIIYHSFTTLVYFFCVFGAILADSLLGKFHTIVWLSIVYVTGSVVITLGAVEPWNMPAMALTFVGLGLIALGSGGIKPCVAAFGGEQFKMPEQAKQLAIFFSMFYFSINLGSFISTLVTPILRENVKCFDMDDCYPFGFGLPAILMALSIIIFLAGKFLYKILPNQGNMLVKVCKCIGNAISTKRKEKLTSPREHWLDYAEGKYGRKLVLETKILLNILVLYIPLPLFWALFDQQGSRWTFQATRMNGDLGWFTIKPDQMQVINPFLILVFIPLYEVAFYPLLNLLGIRRPLQKITLGGIFAGVAFLCSMGVEIYLEPTYPVLPSSGESQFRIFNGRPCTYQVSTSLGGNAAKFELPPNSYFSDLHVNVPEETLSFTYALTTNTAGCTDVEGTGQLKNGEANSFFLTGANAVTSYTDDIDKSRKGLSSVRILANIEATSNVVLQHSKEGAVYNETASKYDLEEIQTGDYEIKVDGNVVGKYKIIIGGVYAIMIHQKGNQYVTDVLIVTEPNSVSMLWLIPQYVIMTLGEVMYSVTGLQFSYTQAPESMKSVLQGCWQLTVGVGNLIVTIIVGAKFFNSQTYEFLLFALLMFVDMGIFMWLGIRYKPIPLDQLKNVEEDDNETKKADPLDFKPHDN